MNPLDKQVYENIARKDLSFWCIINHKVDDDFDGDWHVATVYEIREGSIFFTPPTKCWFIDNSDDITNYEIIGHPIILSDVLHYIHYKRMNIDWMVDSILWGHNNMAVSSWDFRKPTYEEQSEECKYFIRNIVK